MLEVLVRIFCAISISLSIFYINCQILKHKFKTTNNRTIIILLLIQSLILCILYPIQYSGIYTISIFCVYVIIYKIMFKLEFEESLICCSLMMIIFFTSDLIISFIFMSHFPIEQIRTKPILILITNLLVSLLSLLFIKTPKIKISMHNFYNNLKRRKLLSNVLFFILIIIYFCYLVNNISISSFLNAKYITNLIIFIIFIIISYIFIQSRNEYNQLSNEYDNLFSYVQNFEEWIEKEQLNRHEYKNQLAVVRCLTKEKKVKEKIDEILEDNINIEDQAVTNLRNLPKGGIKGLMYYKAAITKKQKIHLTTDVSINEKGLLSKLPEKDIKVLCKLIGIYFDNAIEAAAESRKKNLTIEVYELKDKVNFVFSNTFKNHKNMKDRNSKGVSSKGEGRGNGLYFAGKLIKENSWLEGKQEIIDNYYIQQLTIKKDSK